MVIDIYLLFLLEIYRYFNQFTKFLHQVIEIEGANHFFVGHENAGLSNT